MKKSHERWNEYQAASSEYPKELYKTSEKLEKRIKKEALKRKFLFSTIPTITATILFVILINTSIAFARTISDIPLLSRISEIVMYNESLKSAVENRNIQYVNLKAENGELELKLPYVIADTHNLVLFVEMPENLEIHEDEFYVVSVDHLTDLSTDEFISSGFLNFSGSFSLGQDPLMQIRIEFTEKGYGLQGYTEHTLPQDLELSLSLRKYEKAEDSQNLLAIDSFKFKLSLEEFKEPLIYPLDQEVILDGQKIRFKEMVSYPTRTEITYEYAGENDADMNLHLSLMEDGEKKPLSSYAFMTRFLEDGITRETIHIRSNYFDPPETRSISIDSYTKIREEERKIIVDLTDKSMTPLVEGIELVDIERIHGEIIFTFKTSDRYPYSPFAVITADGQIVEIRKEAARTDNTYLYFIEDGDYESLEFLLGSGPVTFLEEPILIPIPVK